MWTCSCTGMKLKQEGHLWEQIDLETIGTQALEDLAAGNVKDYPAWLKYILSCLRLMMILIVSLQNPFD